MKITYSNPTPPPSLVLDDLCYGSIFRPHNSRRIFMITEMNGESLLLSSDCSTLKANTEEFNHHFDDTVEDYDSLLLCVELDTGKLCLMSNQTYVEELDYEFIVKEA